MAYSAKIRLFVDADLGDGQSLSLDAKQAHYLFGVMRMKVGEPVLLFNGRDGEWLATVTEARKKAGVLTCERQTLEQAMPPDLWLLFAPIKKTRTDFIVEKATELGVAKIQPVQTEFTNSDRVNKDRLQAHAIEAAEQCGGIYVPPVEKLLPLKTVLANWPADRTLIFCDETSAGTASSSLAGEQVGKWAILIGPEGGFSAPEVEFLKGLEKVKVMSLGPRILRADTAAVAAITLWQNTLGDWA